MSLGLYPEVPATILPGGGQYLSVNTFGWTEFEIDADKRLTATTHGIDRFGRLRETTAMQSSGSTELSTALQTAGRLHGSTRSSQCDEREDR